VHPFPSGTEFMHLKTKLFQWGTQGYYLIMVGRGELTGENLKEIFRGSAERSRSSPECKILIDLQDVTTVMTLAEVEDVIHDLELPSKENEVVFVCPAESRHYGAVLALIRGLARRGYHAALFSDPKRATEWLAETSNLSS
jgi:hypothetical protein